MTHFIDTLNFWSDRWSVFVVAAVVQSTLLALIVALAARALWRSSPAVRYWLWQIVAIKLLIVPLWSWSIGVPWLAARSHESVQAVAAPRSATPVAATDHRAVPRPTAPVERTLPAATPGRLSVLTWTSWLMVGWSAIVGLQLVRLLLQRQRLAKALRATTAADAGQVDLVAKMAARLGLARPPRARITTANCSPFVCGIIRPTLVLPGGVLNTLAPAELEQVLAHELAHVKRRDLVWGWIPELARIVYFFHPLAYWASYRIRLERELACDQLALAHGERGPAEYAETLVRVVSAASRPSIFRTSAAAGLSGDVPGVASDPAAETTSERRPNA